MPANPGILVSTSPRHPLPESSRRKGARRAGTRQEPGCGRGSLEAGGRQIVPHRTQLDIPAGRCQRTTWRHLARLLELRDPPGREPSILRPVRADLEAFPRRTHRPGPEHRVPPAGGDPVGLAGPLPTDRPPQRIRAQTPQPALPSAASGQEGAGPAAPRGQEGDGSTAGAFQEGPDARNPPPPGEARPRGRLSAGSRPFWKKPTSAGFWSWEACCWPRPASDSCPASGMPMGEPSCHWP